MMTMFSSLLGYLHEELLHCYDNSVIVNSRFDVKPVPFFASVG